MTPDSLANYFDKWVIGSEIYGIDLLREETKQVEEETTRWLFTIYVEVLKNKVNKDDLSLLIDDNNDQELLDIVSADRQESRKIIQEVYKESLDKLGILWWGYDGEINNILASQPLCSNEEGILLKDINGLDMEEFAKQKIINRINFSLDRETRPLDWIDTVVLHSTVSSKWGTTEDILGVIRGDNDGTPNSHFFVDQEGNISQTASLSTIIDHAGKGIDTTYGASLLGNDRLDLNSIGIEVETYETESRNSSQKLAVQKLLQYLWHHLPSLTKGDVVPHALVWVSKYGYGRKSDPIDKSGTLFSDLWLPNQWNAMIPDVLLWFENTNLENIKKEYTKGTRNEKMAAGLGKSQERITTNPDQVELLNRAFATNLLAKAKISDFLDTHTRTSWSGFDFDNNSIAYVVRNGRLLNFNSSKVKNNLQSGDKLIYFPNQKKNAIFVPEYEGIDGVTTMLRIASRDDVVPQMCPFYLINNIPKDPCSHVIKQVLRKSYMDHEDALTDAGKRFFNEWGDAWDFFDKAEKIGYGKVSGGDLKSYFDISAAWLRSRNPIKNTAAYQQKVIGFGNTLTRVKPWAVVGFYFKYSGSYEKVIKKNKTKTEKRANTHVAMVLGENTSTFTVGEIKDVISVADLSIQNTTLNSKREVADMIARIVLRRANLEKKLGSVAQKNTIRDNILKNYSDLVDVKIENSNGKMIDRRSFTGTINSKTKIEFGGTLLFDHIGKARSMYYREHIVDERFLPTEVYEMKEPQKLLTRQIRTPYNTALGKRAVIDDESYERSFWLAPDENLDAKLKNNINTYFQSLLDAGEISVLPTDEVLASIYSLQIRCFQLQGYDTSKIQYHKPYLFYKPFEIDPTDKTVKIKKDLSDNFDYIEFYLRAQQKQADRIENNQTIRKDLDKNFWQTNIQIDVLPGDVQSKIFQRLKEEVLYYDWLKKNILGISESKQTSLFNLKQISWLNYGNYIIWNNFRNFDKVINDRYKQTILLFGLIKKNKWDEAAQKFIRGEFDAWDIFEFSLQDINMVLWDMEKSSDSHLPEAFIGEITPKRLWQERSDFEWENESKIIEILWTSDQNTNLLALIGRKEWYGEWIGKRKFGKYIQERRENLWDTNVEKIIKWWSKKVAWEVDVSSRWTYQLRFIMDGYKKLSDVEWPTKEDLIGACDFVLENQSGIQSTIDGNQNWYDPDLFGHRKKLNNKDLETVSEIRDLLNQEHYGLDDHKKIIEKLSTIMELWYSDDSEITGRMLSTYLADKYINVNKSKLATLLLRTWEDVSKFSNKELASFEKMIMSMHSLWQPWAMYWMTLNYLQRFTGSLGVACCKLTGLDIENEDVWRWQFWKGKKWIKWTWYSFDLDGFKNNLKDINEQLQAIKSKWWLDQKQIEWLKMVSDFCKLNITSDNYREKIIELVNELNELDLDWFDTNILPTEEEINDTDDKFRFQFFGYVRGLDKYSVPEKITNYSVRQM